MAIKEEASDLLGKAGAEIRKVEQGAEKLVKMIVAAGRTVYRHSGFRKDHEGKDVAETVAHKAGEIIMLPAAEASRLKASGFVTDATAPAAATEGPSVTAK